MVFTKKNKLMKTNSSENWNLIETFTFADGADVDRSVWESPQWISPTDNPSFFGKQVSGMSLIMEVRLDVCLL